VKAERFRRIAGIPPYFTRCAIIVSGGQAPLSGFTTTGTAANKEEEARLRTAKAKISFFI